MTTRERVLTVLLGGCGIVAAAAIALAANAISGREIGLSAEPVSLAASTPRPKPAPAARPERHDDHGGRAEQAEDDLSGEDSVSASNGPSSSSGSSREGGDDDVKRSRLGSGTSGSGSGTSAGTTSTPTTTTSNEGPGSGDDRTDDSGHSGPD